MRYPVDFGPELKRKPICGVLSVAMIAGISFKEATSVIKQNMLPHQKRHGGKTYHTQRCNSLKQLGINFREIKVFQRMTLRYCVLNHCRQGKTYMITTSSHVVTVRDGIVSDQVEIKAIEEHGARRCFVREILEIK